MASASSSHRTNSSMQRTKSTFCAHNGGGDRDISNGLTQGDASHPSLTKPTDAAPGGAQTPSCHHGGHFDPYYYVILGSL